MNFHPDVLAAHAEFGGDLESMQKLYEYPDLKAANARMRDFLGKVQGVCMGVAMSGRDHPNPDGALMELFNEAQAILFPPAASNPPGGRPVTQRIDLEYQVAELFRLKMEEFADWCSENWTVTELQAKADNVFDAKPAGYREGYNAAVEGLRGAIDCFLEEKP